MGKEAINIIRGEYIASAVNKKQYPESILSQVAFIGRSNVGKSSLINSLTRIHNLARVSGQPGKTQTINFFNLTARIYALGEDRAFTLVDLPGYGYAKTSQTNRKKWAKFIDEYFLSSKLLRFTCQLIDIRHEPSALDKQMFDWFVENEIPVLIIATKADKISKGQIQKQVAQIRKSLGVKELPILPYSSQKNIGREELLEIIAQWVLDIDVENLETNL